MKICFLTWKCQCFLGVLTWLASRKCCYCILISNIVYAYLKKNRKYKTRKIWVEQYPVDLHMLFTFTASLPILPPVWGWGHVIYGWWQKCVTAERKYCSFSGFLPCPGDTWWHLMMIYHVTIWQNFRHVCQGPWVTKRKQVLSLDSFEFVHK